MSVTTPGRTTVACATWNGVSVAVKSIIQGEITPQLLKSIESEVADLMSSMHPNCIRVLGLTSQPAQHVSLVTEWLQGGSLALLLRQVPRASEERRLDMFIHVCSAGGSVADAPPAFSSDFSHTLSQSHTST
jgi:serine/threonine protein kinase